MILKNFKITIIGGGHMGQALARGIVRNTKFKASNIVIATPHKGKLKDFIKATNCLITTNNKEAVKDADIVFIAVKPARVEEVINEIKSAIPQDSLVISVAAAVTLQLLASNFDKRMKLVRIMPNIPVALGSGVVGWIGQNIQSQDKKILTEVLSSLGLIIACKSEDQLDRLSLIAGCGPGIIAYIIDMFEKLALDYGFGSHQASELVLTTIEGTIKHMKTHMVSSQQLVEEVATPGGITEEIIHNLKKSKTEQIFCESLEKGYDKIKNLHYFFTHPKK